MMENEETIRLSGWTVDLAKCLHYHYGLGRSVAGAVREAVAMCLEMCRQLEEEDQCRTQEEQEGSNGE